MFGYINPDSPYLFKKDETLYKAVYCGMCKSIGKGCGNFAKSALTYDIAFMSALLHNISGCDVTIEKRRCALHCIRRRFMALPDDISVLLGCVNTVLAYYKLLDDRADGDKKGAFAFMYRRGFKRALKRHPEVEKIIKRSIECQRALERDNCSVIDMACEPTAQMMKEISRYCLNDSATAHTDALCYDIGKWVYLADALDDYDKDVKKGRYNVLYNAFKLPTKKEAVQANGDELNFLFNSLFADMRAHLSNITFHFNHDLTDNIILRGIPLKTRRLVYGKCGEGKKKENEQTQS
ncbi:MAG: DUF5685 family protein [Roseburia sp.]|nr:DUF5685 family protein [Roseburia sp.]